MSDEGIALRLQGLSLQTQTLVMAQLSASRNPNGLVVPSDVNKLFFELGLPGPAKIGNVVSSLLTKKYLAKGSARGVYKLTPMGKKSVGDHLSSLDFTALIAEAAESGAPELGHALHSLVPVTLAPAALVEPLRSFLADHPFETNVFGMTRFPDAKAGTKDPVGRALGAIREECQARGLEFHLASDRAITDDLWTNITGHMWASKYGIALFEDRVERGVNHNLLIEVGAMVMTGRRCALLKDGSIAKLPTDLVGMIYKSVDLEHDATVRGAVGNWIEKDLRIVA